MASKRVTLTKNQAASQTGTALLTLLVEITSDGELSLGEVEKLRSWLDNNQAAADIAAVAWLRELIQDILADGKITPEERVDLILAIERVLPKEQRLIATERRQAAEALTAPPIEEEEDEEDTDDDYQQLPEERSSKPWRPASEAQEQYIVALGGQVAEDMSMEQASKLIDSLLASSKSVSNRQMMVLRFWNRLDVAQGGKRAVSEWMDEWYDEDPDRQAAWSLWKEEHDDRGRQDNPTKVAIGIGERYLKRVKSGSTKSGCLVLAGLVVGALYWLSTA